MITQSVYQSKTEKLTFRLSGNTHPHKAKIKKWGGKWDSENNCWIIQAYKSDAIWAYEGRIDFEHIPEQELKDLEAEFSDYDYNPYSF